MQGRQIVGPFCLLVVALVAYSGAGCDSDRPSGGGATGSVEAQIPFGLKPGTGFQGVPRAVAADAWYEAMRSRGGGSPPAMRQDALRGVLAAGRASRSLPGEPAPGLDRRQSALIQGNVWFPIGPAPIGNWRNTRTSGRANSIAVNPTNPDDIWIGTATGGVWHAVNAPNTQWEPRSDFEESLAIGVVLVDGCITWALTHRVLTNGDRRRRT